MERAGPVGADADADEHEAELRHRRVGQHLLDVVLEEADGGGEQRGERADEGDPVMARGDSTKMKLSRAIMYTPAVTMVAAWMSADTGVGPAMASGSHTCRGNCALLPVAPTKKQMPTRTAAAMPKSF